MSGPPSYQAISHHSHNPHHSSRHHQPHHSNHHQPHHSPHHQSHHSPHIHFPHQPQIPHIHFPHQPQLPRIHFPHQSPYIHTPHQPPPHIHIPQQAPLLVHHPHHRAHHGWSICKTFITAFIFVVLFLLFLGGLDFIGRAGGMRSWSRSRGSPDGEWASRLIPAPVVPLMPGRDLPVRYPPDVVQPEPL
ncbi:hypothetical protein GALMADRAFT_242580 [Galerina marginata CBS 339.88]|uniref:Uncharacterized protein n=1 Tax=Galerina marginata (strain CBS 339.88) TaxID=685588 RepID=A0A067TAR2_GALM3|nr:hypothetical protein GALMADRAFT_242580 [Galerina marginata CBS 339.88]